MAGIRGIGDGWAFQRLLWLLVGLVVAPTALLAFYGASAIRNQDAWLAQQMREAQQLELRDAATELARRIGTLDAGQHATPQPTDGVTSVWIWRTEEPAPDALVAAGLPAPSGPVTRWFSPTTGGPPIGLFESAGRRVAWQLDPPALERHLAAWAAGRAGSARVRLEPPTTGSVGTEPWFAPEPTEVELALRGPFGGWLLVATPDEASHGTVGRGVWLGSVAIVGLVALVLLGAVLTLGSAAREIRLSRLQTDFVSSVSHELRTPLTSIRMFVETLQSGRLKDPDRVAECLALLSLETDRLSRMIERVLGWARMEAGRRVYDLEPVQARELVEDALRALKAQRMMSPEVAIDVRLPGDLPELRVDRDAIVEALLNLLQNAVKFTPTPRRIAVTASVRGAQVGLAVEDNGPGIAKADRKRIFEKFYQADTRLSAAAGTGGERGSGLGLAIVRAVVRGHGGRVELESELGRGSRFTLWLPTATR